MQRILLFLFLFSLLACNVEKDKPSKPVVAVSILPQKYLVSSIADTLLDVLVMVPPGASPATWEASPAQMRSLDHALAYFQIGHIGFE
ncbi:MAG: zinc ABC transporter substrate-binding protein, partial [Bacteroidota bacterium]